MKGHIAWICPFFLLYIVQGWVLILSYFVRLVAQTVVLTIACSFFRLKGYFSKNNV